MRIESNAKLSASKKISEIVECTFRVFLDNLTQRTKSTKPVNDLLVAYENIKYMA